MYATAAAAHDDKESVRAAKAAVWAAAKSNSNLNCRRRRTKMKN